MLQHTLLNMSALHCDPACVPAVGAGQVADYNGACCFDQSSLGSELLLQQGTWDRFQRMSVHDHATCEQLSVALAGANGNHGAHAKR